MEMNKKTPVLEQLEELRKDINEKLAAVWGFTRGYAPSGNAPYKCSCCRFATIETRTQHPVAGMRQYLLCDYCQPPKLEFDSVGRTESMDLARGLHWTAEDNAWARACNKALDGVCF